MDFPPFFASVPSIRVRDPLAELLGAATDGILEYNYVDAVRLAGHSCPTVAAAYVIACRGLSMLYGEAIPQRGEVQVDFADSYEEGVTGVTASVIGLITGTAQEGGFKGLGGQFVRRNLQSFAVELPAEIRLTRKDNGRRVDAVANLAPVAAAPDTFELLRRCVHNQASAEERQRFGQLWQQRVERILLQHWDDDAVFQFHLSA